MKKIVFLFAFIALTQATWANTYVSPALEENAESASEFPFSESMEYVSFNEADCSLENVVVEVDISTEESVVSCTIEGKVTVTTEGGDSVLVEFTITADTCAEAVRVFNNIMEALE